MDADYLIAGAGVAGLACARVLHRAGRTVRVLEKSRGVGGRCATRRIVDDQPVDHGVAYLHGSDPAFLAALREVDGSRLVGWPSRIDGDGPPCQPHADGEPCVAFAEGVSAFPKHLARGLTIDAGVTVATVGPGELTTSAGATLRARTVILTPPIEQLRPMLPVIADTLGVRAVLRQIGTVPCLTVIAAWPMSTPDPGFDLGRYQGPLHLIIHDSTKRAAPRHRVLVLQASAQASRDWSEEDPAIWQAKLLSAAAQRWAPG